MRVDAVAAAAPKLKDAVETLAERCTEHALSPGGYVSDESR